MAQAPKKKEPTMLDDILAGIRKTIIDRDNSDATPAPVRPIAPPKGLANSLEERNKALKDAENAAKGGYKKGGMVKATGKALVHKGELVLPKKLAGKVKKMAMKAGGKKTGSK